MKMVNIAEAKAKLSEHISCVERGEEIVICRHNRPVAKIVSFDGLAGPPARGSALGSLTGKIKVTGKWDGVSSLFTKKELKEMGRDLAKKR